MVLLISFLGFIFVFSLLVLFHEFGHFIVAKRLGIKVDEFAFGFPPKIWSKKKGETKYAINAIPLGGYVKLHGEDGTDENDPRSYAAQPSYKKTMILVAGVIMNIVLALLIFSTLYLVGFQPINPQMAQHDGLISRTSVVVDTVEKDSPADKEGIEKGDVIVRVDGKDVFTQVQVITLIQAKIKEKNQEIAVIIRRDKETLEKTITPYKAKVTENKKEVEVTKIGVVLQEAGKIRAGFVDSFKFATIDVATMVKETMIGIFDLVKQIVVKKEVSESVYGPIGIFTLTGSAAQLGLSVLLQFCAILSIAVGVFNILPVPGLDGGHILVLGIEAAFRRKFSNKTRNMIQLAGFGALILLVLVVTFKDLARFGIIK